MKADTSREAIYRKGIRSDDFGKGAACETQNGLELKGAILPVAESEREPCVVVAFCADVRNAPNITANLDVGVHARDVNATPRQRQTPTEKEAEERSREIHRESTR